MKAVLFLLLNHVCIKFAFSIKSFLRRYCRKVFLTDKIHQHTYILINFFSSFLLFKRIILSKNAWCVESWLPVYLRPLRTVKFVNQSAISLKVFMISSFVLRDDDKIYVLTALSFVSRGECINWISAKIT